MDHSTRQQVRNFKEQFEALTSEALLKKRALGNELSDEAHQAIEEIFADRNEGLPPRPAKAIAMSSKAKGINPILGILFVVASMLAAEAIGHSWIGVLFAVSLIIFWLARWIKSQSLTKEQRTAAREQELLEKDRLDELQLASAKGDLQRVRDLLNYGADVNSKTLTGATALMYAARNGHVDVAKALIDAGIDVNVKAKSKKTAYSIALGFGHRELAEYIKSKSK